MYCKDPVGRKLILTIIKGEMKPKLNSQGADFQSTKVGEYLLMKLVIHSR